MWKIKINSETIYYVEAWWIKFKAYDVVFNNDIVIFKINNIFKKQKYIIYHHITGKQYFYYNWKLEIYSFDTYKIIWDYIQLIDWKDIYRFNTISWNIYNDEYFKEEIDKWNLYSHKIINEN